VPERFEAVNVLAFELCSVLIKGDVRLDDCFVLGHAHWTAALVARRRNSHVLSDVICGKFD